MNTCEASLIETSHGDTGVVLELSGFSQHQVSLVMEMESFFTTLKPIRNLDDFADFKTSMDVFMKRMFADALHGKSETFVLAFDQSNVSKYQQNTGENEDEERKALRNLLKEKNKLYGQLLLKALHMGYLNMILSTGEKYDIESMVTSNILAFFDDVYINWLECANDENRALGLKPESPLYGGIQDGKMVGYGAFSHITIDTSKLASIQNPHIRDYLSTIHKLLAGNVSEYSQWVDAEIHESKVWKDSSSQMGFISPMEDYVFAGVLVEPELLVLLKDPRNAVNYSDFYNLSSIYFGDRYGMDHMTCTHVETILRGGDATYSGFIGKTFPNDLELGKQEGNNIILMSSPMKVVVANAKQAMLQLFPGTTFDQDTLRSELVKEVTYHEFGHSLFVKGHPTSLLEEAKATLFYYLSIHAEHTQEKYSKVDIERVVHFTILDSLRTIERLDQSQYYKYSILMKTVLAPLFASGLLEIGEVGLQVNATKQNFDVFLGSLKDSLFTIQHLYTLDSDTLKREEAAIIEKLDTDTREQIDYIAQKMKAN